MTSKKNLILCVGLAIVGGIIFSQFIITSLELPHWCYRYCFSFFIF
ncbi:RNA-binding protein [Vibrio sp. JCM 19053]|nr:RNA-binding protein [Vibrio sp. JCM 19053]